MGNFEGVDDPMRHFPRLQDMQSMIGQEIGVSEWITVDQQRIDQFAVATGDHQWIHVDPAKAAEGPFGTTIAHGFLTLSLMPEMFASAFHIDDVRMGVNYGLNKVRFTAPVPSGGRVRGHFVLHGFHAIEGGAQMAVNVTVELEGSSKPACVAEALSRRYV